MKEVTTLEKSYGIRDYEGSEISKLKFGLVPVMYNWAKQVVRLLYSSLSF